MAPPTNRRIGTWSLANVIGAVPVVVLAWVLAMPVPAAAALGSCPATSLVPAFRLTSQQLKAAAPDASVIEDLVRWIGRHTHYDISRTLANAPEISFCSAGDVIAYESNDLLVDEKLKAAYDLKSRRIFLVLPWTASRGEDLSVLLHELIHDVQLHNRTWECSQQTEWEAYRLQAAWLAENGIEANFNWAEILIRSRCLGEHP